MFNALKHIALSAFFALSLLLSARAQEADTAVFNALDAKLAGYVKAIEPLDVEAQKEECSFLISSCTDSLVRQHVALYLYANYVKSAVMGVEAVAIDIADNWFFTGKVRMKNDIDLMNARIFADFNRQSLVGEKAPELVMKDDKGLETNLFTQPSKRYSVLYFYDTGCPDSMPSAIRSTSMPSMSVRTVLRGKNTARPGSKSVRRRSMSVISGTLNYPPTSRGNTACSRPRRCS